MADKKISELSASTVPLSGSELVPIVQGGVTKKVAVSNLTAGRTVNADTFSATSSLAAGSGGTGTALGAVYLNGGNGGGGSFVQGQKNSSPTWLIGDTSAALGSGTGMIEFIYGGAPKITWLQGIGEVHRSVEDGIQFPAGKGIVLTNAAGTVTKLVRLNDAGDGLIFENP